MLSSFDMCVSRLQARPSERQERPLSIMQKVLPHNLQQDLKLSKWAWVDSNHRPHSYQAPAGRQPAPVGADFQGFPGLSADQRQLALVGVVTACVTAICWQPDRSGTGIPRWDAPRPMMAARSLNRSVRRSRDLPVSTKSDYENRSAWHDECKNKHAQLLASPRNIGPPGPRLAVPRSVSRGSQHRQRVSDLRNGPAGRPSRNPDPVSLRRTPPGRSRPGRTVV